MRGTSSAVIRRELPTDASISACAFLSVSGWFSNSDIAHSIVVEVVSVPAPNKFFAAKKINRVKIKLFFFRLGHEVIIVPRVCWLF